MGEPKFKPDADVHRLAERIRREMGRMDRRELEMILATTLDAVLMQSATMAVQRARIDELDALTHCPACQTALHDGACPMPFCAKDAKEGAGG